MCCSSALQYNPPRLEIYSGGLFRNPIDFWGRFESCCLRLNSEQTRKRLVVGFLKRFWTDFEKHKGNISGLGQISINYSILRGGMEFKNFDFSQTSPSDIYLVHIWSQTYIFLSFWASQKRYCGHLCSFEKNYLSTNVQRYTDSEMRAEINGADWICEKIIFWRRIRIVRSFSNLE